MVEIDLDFLFTNLTDLTNVRACVQIRLLTWLVIVTS